MEQGDIMIGTNINVPGTIGDPEISAWFRVAPLDGTDITAGAFGSIPITSEANLPSYGGFLQLRAHIPMTAGWRLVLDGQGEFQRHHARVEDWSNHWRASLTPYFVAELSKISFFFGPKGSWLTGLREVAAPFGSRPVRPVPDAPGLVFAGVSIGAEDPQPVWFFTSVGGAFDLGTVIAADTGSVTVPLAYSMSVYLGFL